LTVSRVQWSNETDSQFVITYNVAMFVDSVVWMTTRTDERKTPENALTAQQKVHIFKHICY